MVIRLLDISLISLQYFAVCAIASYSIDRVWANIDFKSLPWGFVLVMVALQFACYTVVLHVIRKLVHMTPWRHKRDCAKELDGGITAGGTLLLFCPNLLAMAKHLRGETV